MVRSSRLHRLPQRLDYTLIPAPLDLTVPLVDEKSPLPAIIVTPSSPRSSADFSIAFLAPKQKPSWRERLASCLPRLPFSSEQPISLATTPSKSNFPTPSAPFKTHSIIIMFVLLFVMACHVAAHRFAVTPRMDFHTKGFGLGEASLVGTHGSLSQSQPSVHRVGGNPGWVGVWDRDDTSDFVVRDVMRTGAGVENGGVDVLPGLS